MRRLITVLFVLAFVATAPTQDTGVSKRTLYITATTKANESATVTPEQCQVAPGLKINALERLGAQPISYIVAIDTSNSGRNQFAGDVNIAKMLLSKFIRPQVDKGMVLSFDMQVETSDFVSDPTELTGMLASLKPFGGTALFDALYISAQTLVTKAPESQPRVMFLITDGEDNQSKVTYSEAVSALIRAGIRIYPIWNSPALIDSRGGRVLTRLASETGGTVLEPERKGRLLDFERPARILQADLSSWHRLELAIPKGEKAGTLHGISLHCGPKGAHVKAAESYVAGE